MARRRASMREGPLAELFRSTEAAQRQSQKDEEPKGAAGAARAVRGAPTVETGRPLRERRGAGAGSPQPPSRLPTRAAGARRRRPKQTPQGQERPGGGAAGDRPSLLEPAPRMRATPTRRPQLLPRRHPGRRRGRGGPERRQPDDRSRPLAGRVHRREHGHPAAEDVRGAREAARRARAHPGPRLGLRPGRGTPGRPRTAPTRSSTCSAARTWSS